MIPSRFLCAALFAAALSAQTIVVSPDGPIHTLAQARAEVHVQRDAGRTGTITIQVRDGTYFLDEALVLTAADSDTVWEAAPGARPVISGGRVIAGWLKGPGPLWKADSGGSSFRQLFIGGRRAQRARTPNYGFYRIDGPSPQDKPLRLHFRGNDIRREWAEAGDVEVIAYFAWADIRMPIVSVDEESHIATLTGDPRPSNKEADARYYIENAPDGLDTPGEWRLDRKSHTVFYWPMAGENMADEQVIAPELEHLVELRGVHDVTFRGLQFAHAAWRLPPGGYADTQAAVPAPAAIVGINATGCKIERCTIAHSGGYGVFFGRGSKRNQVLASELYDLGAGGIKLGEPQQYPDDADQNYENVVADNHIHDLGLVYAPAVGVWVLQSGRNQIVHNHIHDLYLHRDFRGLDVGLRRQPVQGQRDRVQPPARHRQGDAERHGRHLHAGRAAGDAHPQQPDPRHRVVHLWRVGHLSRRRVVGDADRKQHRLPLQERRLPPALRPREHRAQQHLGVQSRKPADADARRAAPLVHLRAQHRVLRPGTPARQQLDRRPVRHERQCLLRYSRPGHPLRRQVVRGVAGRRQRCGVRHRRPAVRQRRQFRFPPAPGFTGARRWGSSRSI